MPNTSFELDQNYGPVTTKKPDPGTGLVTIPTQPTAPQPVSTGGTTMTIPTLQPTAPLNPAPSGTTVGIPTRQPTAPIGGTTQTPPIAVPQLSVTGAPNTGAPPVPAFTTPAGNQPPASFAAGNVVNDLMAQTLNPNSPYIQSATRHGLDVAHQRGLLNSSIASGTSQRAAIDAAMPLVSEAASIQKQRESYASQDWLANNSFNREFAGTLALLPIQNSFQMLNALFQYAAEDPATYTPAVVNEMSNFFTQNMQNIMSTYFNTGGSRP
jgi:hypothetical protein